MADSWRDSEVAVGDQAGAAVISRFPPGTLSSVRLSHRWALKAPDQSRGSRFPHSEIHEPRSLLNIHPTHVTNYGCLEAIVAQKTRT